MFDSNSFCSLALCFYREICQLPSDMSRTCLESKTTIILGLGMEIQFEKIWFFMSISYYANFSNLPSKILTLAIFCNVLRKYINPDIWQFLTIALNWISHFKAVILYSIGITFAKFRSTVNLTKTQLRHFAGSSLPYPMHHFSSQRLLVFLQSIPKWTDILKVFWWIQIKN